MNRMNNLLQKFKDMAGAILIGNGLGGLIQGVLGGITFALFDLKSPFTVGSHQWRCWPFYPLWAFGIVFLPAAAFFAV